MSELFAIDCTTCKSRLRVRDAALIGQILACPKCSSMVLIEPPSGWQPPATSSRPTNAEAPPAAASGDADPTSLKETVSDSEFREADALRRGEPGQLGTASRSATPQPQSTVAQPQKPVTERAAPRRRHTPPAAPAPPTEQVGGATTGQSDDQPLATTVGADWTPSRTKRIRLVAMLTVAGCMGVASAVGAATFFASWAGGPRTPEIAQSSESPLPPPSSESESSAPMPSDNDAIPVAEESADAASSPVVEAVPAPPEVDTATPAAEKPPMPAAPVVAEKMPPSEKTKDPLGLVDDATPGPMEEAPDPLKLNGLRRLAGLIPGDENPPPAEPSSAIDSSAESSSDADTAPASESRPRPEMRKIDVAARLADRLSEIEFNGQPLVEVIQFLSDFSTIPITIEPEALTWSRITPSVAVKAKLTDVSLRDVLTEVLKPFRLEAIVSDDQVVITRSPSLRLIKCPIGDLTDGDAEKQKQLIEFIEQLASPTSWKSAGGEGTIVPQGDLLLIENNELAYGEVMQVCERLRLARGGRPKSVFPAEVFALERRSERAAKKLDTPLTLNFSQPTLLARILQRFGKESGTTILVDWRALAEVGWPPEADATVTVSGSPLRQALAELLGPMDLTYRVVDGKTLQVTTAQAIQRQPEIEVHAVADLAPTAEEGAALIERLTPVLGDNAVVRYDSAGKTLFALLPQPQQEQLAELLAELRRAK